MTDHGGVGIKVLGVNHRTAPLEVRERFAHEHLAHLAILLEHRVEEGAEERRSGKRVDAHLPVGLRAYWIVHLCDDLLQAKDLLSDLGRHEVSVITLGQGEECVGALDACLTEHVEVRAVSEDRFALEGGRQMLEPGALRARRTRRRDIDDADAMALGVEKTREESTHTTTPDNDDVHLVSS